MKYEYMRQDLEALHEGWQRDITGIYCDGYQAAVNVFEDLLDKVQRCKIGDAILVSINDLWDMMDDVGSMGSRLRKEVTDGLRRGETDNHGSSAG